MNLIIGTRVNCSDGLCGLLRRLIIEPGTRSVTDIVVEPEHRSGLARRVPVALIDDAPSAPEEGEIFLRCDTAGFEGLPRIEELVSEMDLTSPAADALYGYGGNVSVPEYRDEVPSGETELGDGVLVVATDGPVGEVAGAKVDPDDHRITGVLLKEGHLWHRKEVAIAIDAVADIGADEINVRLSKSELRELPPIGAGG